MAITINWMRAKRAFVSAKKETTFRRKLQKKKKEPGTFLGVIFQYVWKLTIYALYEKWIFFCEKRSKRWEKPKTSFFSFSAKANFALNAEL